MAKKINKKIMKKRRRKKSRQSKRYSQIIFVSTLLFNFFSASSKKIRIRHFVLFLAHYATIASDSFTVAMLAEKPGPPPPLAQGLDPPLIINEKVFVIKLTMSALKLLFCAYCFAFARSRGGLS